MGQLGLPHLPQAKTGYIFSGGTMVYIQGFPERCLLSPPLHTVQSLFFLNNFFSADSLLVENYFAVLLALIKDLSESPEWIRLLYLTLEY